jgi:coproporphyrinogen III oxidase-like Fe-S oxidoreductase
MKMDIALLNKYNIPVPRYTSYPTIPNWDNDLDLTKWKETFKDQFIKYILDISCKSSTLFQSKDLETLKEFTFPELIKLKNDGLVEWNERELVITSLGLHFIRNICRTFDLHLLRKGSLSNQTIFSKAI